MLGCLDAIPPSAEEPIYGIIFAAATDFSKLAMDAFRRKTRQLGERSMLRVKKLVGHAIHVGAALSAFGLAAAAAMILINQGLDWLRTGYWPPRPISMFLSGLGMRGSRGDWVGWNMILDWLGNLHCAVLLVFVALMLLGVAGVGVRVAEDATIEMAKRRSEKRKAAAS